MPTTLPPRHSHACWQDLTRHLADVAGRLDAQAAERWRPPEWDREWNVAAYAVVHGLGGMRSVLDVAEGVERDELRAALAKWLTDHQAAQEGSVSYMVILVRTTGGAKLSFELSFGNRSDWPATQPQYLVAHAILDLTAESSRRRRA